MIRQRIYIVHRHISFPEFMGSITASYHMAACIAKPEKEKAAAHNAGGFVSLGILQTRDFKVMRQNFCLDCHDIAFYFGKLYVLDVVEPFIQ